MFFIFGWNRQEVTSYGPVEKHECQNCHNTEFWHLNKVSKYFTLFFIPIFPHDSMYWYFCPICNYGVRLENDISQNYKVIAEINSAFIEKKISEEERVKKLEEIYKTINKTNEGKKVKSLEESKDFIEQVMAKSNEELLDILNKDKSDYNPAFIIAVEDEIKKRQL